MHPSCVLHCSLILSQLRLIGQVITMRFHSGIVYLNECLQFLEIGFIKFALLNNALQAITCSISIFTKHWSYLLSISWLKRWGCRKFSLYESLCLQNNIQEYMIIIRLECYKVWRQNSYYTSVSKFNLSFNAWSLLYPFFIHYTHLLPIINHNNIMYSCL